MLARLLYWSYGVVYNYMRWHNIRLCTHTHTHTNTHGPKSMRWRQRFATRSLFGFYYTIVFPFFRCMHSKAVMHNTFLYWQEKNAVQLVGKKIASFTGKKSIGRSIRSLTIYAKMCLIDLKHGTIRSEFVWVHTQGRKAVIAGARMGRVFAGICLLFAKFVPFMCATKVRVGVSLRLKYIWLARRKYEYCSAHLFRFSSTEWTY